MLTLTSLGTSQLLISCLRTLISDMLSKDATLAFQTKLSKIVQQPISRLLGHIYRAC